MKDLRSTLVPILAFTIVVSLIQHQGYSGAYARSSPAEKLTFVIGPASTTLPLAFWALVSFSVAWIRRGHPNHIAGMIGGYLAGWLGMTAFTFWIVTWPRTYGHSSTMAIAIGLTAFIYAAIFPILFPFGYCISRVLLYQKREI